MVYFRRHTSHNTFKLAALKEIHTLIPNNSCCLYESSIFIQLHLDPFTSKTQSAQYSS